MNRDVRTGRVVEFAVDNQLGYGVVTGKEDTFGDLLFVLDTVWEARPAVLEDVVSGTVIAVAYTVLSAAVRRKLARIVGTVPLRGPLLHTPRFRTNVGTIDRPVWRLWTSSGPDGPRVPRRDLLKYPVLRTVTIPWVVAILKGDIPPEVRMKV